MPIETNFLPNPASVWVPPSVYYGDLNASGTGDPNGQVVAWPGASYLDTANGDRWSKESGEGTLTGWTLDGGGSGGLTGSGSPEGVEEGAIGQHYWDSANRIDYIKTSGAGTDTGWEIFLGI